MEQCTIYFSTSDKLAQEVALLTLLQQSRRANARDGITGVLLYVRGSIVQVLEGDKEAVDALYGRIQQDERHTNVTLVLNRLITKRLFAEWLMGYETITGQQLEDIKSLVNLDSKGELASEQGTPGILKMIKAFYQGNHYN